ncbi:MAG TPA: acyl-CoA thioesterase domain-containing protein [Caulobacteraceae bacterium]|nr:acyl-CoA thioesterase domain-containing protein [Caulobacteraceae bacterium]
MVMQPPGNIPFFTRAGGAFIPGSVSRGPWSATSLHARVLIGLLAAEIEGLHGGPLWMPARLTVDLWRLPDLSPAEVTVRPLREGGRVKVIDAEYVSGGVTMARASCQLLRRTTNPPVRVWSPPPWDAPRPEDIPPPAQGIGDLGGMWTTRPITGAFGSLGQRRLWMAEVRELVAGEALTPFVRAALAADFASPFANAGEGGLAWINSDVTLYLHRLPVSEWIGVEVINHHATDGVAIAECWFHDVQGPIGSSSVAALAQRRGMGG